MINIMNIEVSFLTKISKWFKNAYKEFYITAKEDLFPGMQGWFNTQKSINIIYLINRKI